MGGAVGSYIVKIIINLIIAYIAGRLLAPDEPESARDEGLKNNIRSNVAPRTVGYGEFITGGPWVLLETVGQNDQWLNMIIVLTGHPVEDIIGVFINEEYVNISGPGGTSNLGQDSPWNNDLDGNYWVKNGPYGSTDSDDEEYHHVKIIKNLGWGYADNQYVTDGDSTKCEQDRERSNIIQDTIVTAWNTPEETQSDRDSLTGLYPGSGYKLTNCAHVFCRFKYNREVFTNYPRVKFHVKGKLLYNPNLDSGSQRLIQGADGGSHVFGDPDTYEYSEDWSLCILDYLLNTSYGLGAKTEGILTEVDWESAIQAHKDSSESVTNGLTGPAEKFTPRYTINGIFKVSSTPISNMEGLLASGSGELVYAQGQYKIRPGVYRLPVSEANIINEDMMVSPLTLQTHTPRSRIFNKASGIFTDKGYDQSLPIDSNNLPIFESSDFIHVDPLDGGGLNPYEVIDGEEIIVEFDFPFTVNDFEAQRLARIQLERIRRGLLVQFEATLEVLKYSVGDTVYLEILNDSKYINEVFFNKLGLDDTVQDQDSPLTTPYYKQFKILEMQYTENFTISVSMIEETQKIYDWNSGDAAEPDNALVSDLIIDDPHGVVLPPSFIMDTSPYVAIEELVAEQSGTLVTTLVSWQAPDRGSVVNALDRAAIGSYNLEYGIVDNPSNPDPSLRVSIWQFAGTILSDHSQLRQGPISLQTLYKDGQEYDFRVRSRAYIGRASVWVYYSEETGDDYSPSEPPASSNNHYYILPTNGTAIHNHIGTLVIEARQIIGGVDTLISEGIKQLFVNGTVLVDTNSPGNFSSPSDGYTGYLNSDDINDSIVVELRNGPGSILYDTITLVDIEDGVEGSAGADAIFGFIEADNGLAWTRAPDAGAWTPSQLTTDLRCTFVQGAAEVAIRTYRITLTESTGVLNGAWEADSTDLNTGRITESISGSGTTAFTIQFNYLDSPDVASVAETVGSTQGGSDGTGGIDSRTVNVTIGQQAFQYKSDDSYNDIANTTVTATALNTEGTPYYEFFVEDAPQQNGTSNTYTYTPQSDYADMPEKIEVHLREDGPSGLVYAKDQITVFGVKMGGWQHTIVQSNEAHTIPVNNLGVADYTNSGNTITVYLGIDQASYDSSIPYAPGSWRLISAVGTNITAGGNSSGVISEASNMSGTTAYITYVFGIVDQEGLDFPNVTRIQTFSKSIDGDDGIFYYIKPTNGTAIRNGGSETLTIEAHYVEGASDNLLSSGTIKLYDPSDNVIDVNSPGNYPSPSDGYTGTLGTADINGDIVVTLKDDVSGEPLDTITLVDIQDGVPGSDAIYGFIEPDNGLAWSRAPDGGVWTPSQLTTDLRCTFVKSGVEQAIRTYRVTLNEFTGVLSGAWQADSTDLNTGRITESISGDTTTSYTVQFNYLNSPDVGLIAETVLSTQGGDSGSDAYYGYIRATDGLAWTQENNGGAWNPASISTQLDFTVVQAGVIVAQDTLLVIRDSADGTLTAAESPNEHSNSPGNFTNSPGVVDITVTGSGTQALTAVFDYTNGADGVSVGQTVTTSIGADDGDPGAGGQDGYTASLTADYLAITYDSAGANPSPTSVLFTATAYNYSTPYYRFVVDGVEHVGWSTDPTPIAYDVPTDSGDMPEVAYVEVKEGSGGSVTAYDAVTLVAIQPGASGGDGDDAITIILSNDSHTIPTDNDGDNGDYSYSGTLISVYEGITPLDYDGVGTTPGHWNVTASTEQDITAGSISDSTNDALVANASAMTGGTGTLTAYIEFTITGERGDGSSLGSIVKRQTFSKSLEGDGGPTGPGGADGKVGWGHTIVFTATDHNTIEWANNGQIKLADGTTYTITPADDLTVGSIDVPEYIYFDSDASTTVLQDTTNPFTAVGENKILICVAEYTDADMDISFTVFGGRDGITLTGDRLVANSIVANNMHASFYTGRTFQTRELGGSPTTARAAMDVNTGFTLHNKSDELIYQVSEEGDDGHLFIGGTSEIEDINSISIAGWDPTTFDAIRAGLGVEAIIPTSGGTYTYLSLPANISGTSDLSITGNTPDGGVITHLDGNDITVSCRVYDPGWAGWFDNEPTFSTPVYRVTFYRGVSPYTWPGNYTAVDTYTELTGRSTVIYDGEHNKWWGQYSINLAATEVDDPGGGDGDYKYRVLVDYQSGSYSSANQISAFTYSEAIVGDPAYAGIDGSPNDNEIAVWVNSTDIEGDSNLTWDGTDLTASNFTGDGSALTALTPANISDGNLGSGVHLDIDASGTNLSYKVPFMNSTSEGSGATSLFRDSGAGQFTYNPNTNALVAGSYSGVTLTTGGSSSNYLNEAGSYSTPAGGGAVDSVVSSGAIDHSGTVDVTISHSSSAGNKHVPTGGSSNQFLKYSTSGTAVWSAVATGDIANLSGTNTGDNSANSLYSGLVSDTGEPGILRSGGSPTLASGVSAAEVRSLIGAGTGSGSVTSVGTNTGLSGTVTGSGNLSLDLPSLAIGAALIATDWLIASNGGVQNRQTISTIPLSIFYNDEGWGPGGGDVTASGSPLNNEIAVFSSGTNINSDPTFTWDGGTLDITGSITASDQIVSSIGIMRDAHHTGALIGSYNSVGANEVKSNPIYTIGASYNPTDAALSNMHGIGFCTTNATFINSTDLGVTPSSSKWGMYVAGDGNARVFLDGTAGHGYFKGNLYSQQAVFRGTLFGVAATFTGTLTANGTIVGDGATTISGIETYTVDSTGDITKASHGNYLFHKSASYDNDQNGEITSNVASGGTTGDIWFRYTA